MPVPTTPSGQIEYLNYLYRGAEAVGSPQTVAPAQQISTAQWVQQQRLEAAARATADTYSRPTLPSYPTGAMQSARSAAANSLPAAVAAIPGLADSTPSQIASNGLGRLSASAHALNARIPGAIPGGVGAALAVGGTLASGGGLFEAIGSGIGAFAGTVGGTALGGAAGAIAGPGGAAVGGTLGGAAGGAAGAAAGGSLGRMVDKLLGLDPPFQKVPGVSPVWVYPSPPSASGGWTVPLNVPSNTPDPQGVPGVLYDVGIYGILSTGAEAGPMGTMVMGGWSVEGVGTRQLRLIGSGVLQADLRSDFYEWVAYRVAKADPQSPEPPFNRPSDDVRPSTPPVLPDISDYPAPPPIDPYPGVPSFPPSLNPNPAPSPQPPNQQAPPPSSSPPGPQPNQSSPPQSRPAPGGSGLAGGLGQGVKPDQVVEYVPGVDWGEFTKPAFERDPKTGGLLQIQRDVTNAPATSSQTFTPTDLQQAGIIASAAAILATTAVLGGRSLNPNNPISPQGQLNLVPVSPPVPVNTPSSPANPGQNAPTCRYDALGISGKVDTANTTLSAVQIFQQEQIMGKLNTIDTKLGAQVDGGLSGYLKKMQDFAEVAWKTIRGDRILNALNFALTLHNAYMLSANLAQSMTFFVDTVFQAIGFSLKDEKNEDISVSQFIGGSIEGFFASLIGAANVEAAKATLASLNRIVVAAFNLYYSLSQMIDSVRNMVEIVGERVSKLGNVLRRAGQIFERDWPWANENWDSKVLNPTRFERFGSRVSALDNTLSMATAFVSEIVNLRQLGQDVKDQRKELSDSLKAAGYVPEDVDRTSQPVQQDQNDKKADSEAPVSLDNAKVGGLQ